jgi:hypothetical protein
VEFSVDGLRKGSFARFAVSLGKGKSFAVSYSIEYRGRGGYALPAHGEHGTFAEALSCALAYLRLRFDLVATSEDSVTTDHHRAAARAGIEWCDARAAEWGLTLATVPA